ncbi:MAG: tRNA (Cmo5U34)-methyltransferase [Gammaproteobacteria bacterium]|nr:tRNA (Cmo5U34)-methyltransferase [Gammaproteobacteria bacterium]
MSKPTEKSQVTDRDTLFQAEQRSHDFDFDANTAGVFDDMVQRSVPFYEEIQRMTCELAKDFSVPGTNLYDIGCATGTSLEMLDPLLDRSVAFVGVDNSGDMLEKARQKLRVVAEHRRLELVNSDIHANFRIENASVVMMILTLQFIRPLHREDLLRRINEALSENGCLLLIEKVTGPYSLLNRLFIDHYYDFKRRSGYSELEISRKRESLENVLIPYHIQENRELLFKTGFTQIEEFFRWYNFCGIVAVK